MLFKSSLRDSLALIWSTDYMASVYCMVLGRVSTCYMKRGERFGDYRSHDERFRDFQPLRLDLKLLKDGGKIPKTSLGEILRRTEVTE